MSRYNRKGFMAVPAVDSQGNKHSFPVRKGSKVDGQRRHRFKKAKREAQKNWREYKASLREIKKRIPLAERGKANLSRIPERYL